MTVTKFISYLKNEKRVSEHTLTAYHADLLQFQKFIHQIYGIFQWNDIESSQVRSWMAFLLEQGLSPASIRRKLSSVKSFYTYSRRENKEWKDPTKGIQTPKLKKRLVVTADQVSLSRLFANLPETSDFPIARDKVLLELLYGTGLRRSELIELKDQDVHLDENRLRVIGKGSKERLIPFSHITATAIKEYLEWKKKVFSEQLGGVFLLTDKGKQPYPKWVYNKVKYYLATIPHLERASPHVLRHSFATHLSDEGADLNAIKELLGHNSLAATQIYTHNSLEKLKRSYEQAHPKAKEKD